MSRVLKARNIQRYSTLPHWLSLFFWIFAISLTYIPSSPPEPIEEKSELEI